MVKHIVMWKFKDGTEKEQQEFFDGLMGLYGVVPQHKACEIRISAEKDAQFDACLISEFDTLEDVKAYKVDPRHVKVSSLCKSIRTDRASIDYEF